LINESNSHGRHGDPPEAKAKPTTAIGREQFLRSAVTAFVSENSKFPDSVAAALLLMRAGFLG
jgi:hypothetical protein